MTLSIIIPLSSSVRSRLSQLCCGLAQVEWKEASDLFILIATLEINDEGLIVEMRERLREIDLPPFSVKLRGVQTRYKKGSGSFWVGVEECQALLDLNKAIKMVLKDLEVKCSYFTPRVVLGGYKKLSPERLGAYLEEYAPFSSPPLAVPSFALVACHTTLKREIMTPLESFPFRGDLVA